MSLINDALQRAKQVQQDQPAADTRLRFQPVETGRIPRKVSGTTAWPLALGTLAVLAVLVAARQFRGNTTAAPASRSSAGTTAPSPAAPAASATSPVHTPSIDHPANAAARTAPALPVMARTSDAAATAVAGNAPSATMKSTPAPAVPRLQAIVYNSTRPSAIVNGKTVYVNSRVGEFRVRAITPDSVTLAGETRTNVLTLEE